MKLAGVIKTNINEMYICMYCIRLSLKILGKLGISTLKFNVEGNCHYCCSWCNLAYCCVGFFFYVYSILLS